jgi:hypothetical protein
MVVLKKVTLVDCSSHTAGSLEYWPRTQEELAVSNWGQINGAFSEPVNRNDDLADYAPTQFLAEAFRSAGFEGVMYNSQLGEGKNVALFDIDAAAVASRRLYRTAKIVVQCGPLDDDVQYEVQYKGVPGVFEPRPEPEWSGITDNDVPF